MAKLTLLRNLLHEGKTRLAGEVIEVSDELKNELIGKKLAGKTNEIQEAEIVSETKKK